LLDQSYFTLYTATYQQGYMTKKCRGIQSMQQPSASIELSQFANLSTFALQLAQSYISWRAAGSGEDVFSYFNRNPRNTGDEHSLRVSLICQHILPVFNYTFAQIEYESQKRDITLWNQNQHDKRKIAIIETKSSSVCNLTSIRRGHETPIEQIERYLTQAGLYLGVLTNGDEWHLFDFAVGYEPLSSFSLIELAELLRDAPTQEIAKQRLESRPLLRQALAVTYYYLDARRWEEIERFRQRLADKSYHRIKSLQDPRNVEIFVQQIKQVLGSLRVTIRAQFALLQQSYNDYQQRHIYTSATDSRPFEETWQSEIEKIVQFGVAFRLDTNGQLLDALSNLLTELREQYFASGDISAFESEYLLKAADLFSVHNLSQTSFLEKKRKVHSVRLPALDDLKAILQAHYAYLASLDDDYAISKKAIETYITWKESVRNVFGNPQDEFCLQTAYIHFVRIFFVRVCEDHGLIPRRISDGPFARYEQYRLELLTGIKDTYLRLLEETYQRASSVYHNFFDHQKLFDWLTLDEYTILALFDLLNYYDFQGLSSDVLGRVYTEGYIENKDRSEKGQFYTPPQVVDYMLDSLDIPNVNELDKMEARSFLPKTVADLSCGSGTFLVTAAARKSAILQRLVTAREVDSEHALQVLTDTFLGFDLNPFACYLAEINLLIQCLPFLLDDQGKLCRSVDRFHIYCADSIEPTSAEQIYAAREGKATDRMLIRPQRPRGQVLSLEEQRIVRIKEDKGLPFDLTHINAGQQGIDYLVGNPPYVSAGESSDNLHYRNDVWNFGIYQLLHQRWDLFVPFFERNLQFLRPEIGRLGLIVSNGIETEGYAERLRQVLSSQYSLLQIDFFPGLHLFQDAAVENTIVLLENRPPDEQHEVIRRRHLQADCKHFETLPPMPQVLSNGQIFRWRYNPVLDKSVADGCTPLCSIVYIGTGVEAQSDEDSDPVINGRRQKRFTLNDVFLPPSNGATRPAEYIDDGVLGDDVDRYYLRRKRDVAYEKFRPQMRGPRHIALFRTPEKLLLGETSGGYYDRAGLFANHSVQVVVSWQALEQAGVLEEKGIQTVLRKSRQIAGIINGFAPVAELFDLRYLLGIINSRFMREYIASNMHEGTREGRIYPDIWKRLPIKVASTERQQQIAILVDAIQTQYQQLAALPTPSSLATDSGIHYRDIQGYLAQGVFQFFGDVESAIAENPIIRDGRLILRRQPLTYLESSDPELLRYIELYLTDLHPELRGWIWAEARKRIQAPVSLEAVHTFMASVDNITTKAQQINTTINRLSSEIETLIEATYKEPADIEKLDKIKNAKRTHGSNGELF